MTKISFLIVEDKEKFTINTELSKLIGEEKTLYTKQTTFFKILFNKQVIGYSKIVEVDYDLLYNILEDIEREDLLLILNLTDKEFNVGDTIIWGNGLFLEKEFRGLGIGTFTTTYKEKYFIKKHTNKIFFISLAFINNTINYQNLGYLTDIIEEIPNHKYILKEI